MYTQAPQVSQSCIVWPRCPLRKAVRRRAALSAQALLTVAPVDVPTTGKTGGPQINRRLIMMRCVSSMGLFSAPVLLLQHMYNVAVRGSHYVRHAWQTLIEHSVARRHPPACAGMPTAMSRAARFETTIGPSRRRALTAPERCDSSILAYFKCMECLYPARKRAY